MKEKTNLSILCESLCVILLLLYTLVDCQDA